MRAVPTAFILSTAFFVMSQPSYADDAIAVTQRVIERQIEAFLRDDAEAAYSFAAPAIKARYPDKTAFFAMIRKNYEPVYHPGNYAFGRSRSMADGALVFHELLISGKDGKDWKAIYKLARQPDGDYKIDGVLIAPEIVSKGI